MTTSPESLQERQRWEDLESEMDDFLSCHGTRCDAEIVAVGRSVAILEGMSSAEPDRLRMSSRSIVDSLSESIRIEMAALDAESSDLASRVSAVGRLEDEAEFLRRSIADMSARRRELVEVTIPLHASRASENVAEIDETRSRHVRDNAKITRELGLHAILTNIKWDYARSGPDVLAGEVSIPEKAVHRRFEFEIDRGDGSASEYEIAERLWKTIEG